jgi:3-oxoadipate enol-lactonase
VNQNRTDWRTELARARSFARRLETPSHRPPVPPPGLPPGRIVDVPGRGEVFVREQIGRPEGPPILLLHGWTASADINWFRVYDDVAGLGRLVAVDHRGHGRGLRTAERFTLEDAADDAAAVLRALDTGPAIVVGYSMGGPISLLLWQRHPELVAGLVLEATALEWRATRRERLLWKLMAMLEFVFRSGRNRGIIERALRDAVEHCPDVEGLLPWLRGELRRGDPEALADAGRALGDYDARSFAGLIDVPASVVVTTKDRLVRPRKQRQLAHAIPRARTFELAGDHDASLVLPGPFRRVTADAIASVIQRLPEGRQRAGFDVSSTRVAGWGV